MRKVCVQGLGAVGAAMAAAIAQVRDRNGSPLYQVVGLDLANPAGKERVNALNAGDFPFETADMDLVAAVKSARSAGNLRASLDPIEYESCDIVVVDVNLDVDFDQDPPLAKFDGFLAAIRTLAERISSGTMVLIETTVPPGTTEMRVVPEFKRIFKSRGLDPDSVLIAHSYERVMPGREYLSSIKRFWRVYSGVTQKAADTCEAFLRDLIDTECYPLTRLNRPVESETAKLLENSFRAVNIAFIDEWSRFAERAGVDLMAVLRAIRMRPTHRNIMQPGFGVGGYCLTKDPLLPGIGARDLFGMTDLSFPFCEAAVRINREMPRATVAILREAIGGFSGQRILLLGATYREDVADTRYSPSIEFVRCVQAEGALVDIQDPFVDVLEDTDGRVLRVLPDPAPYAGVVFAVRHGDYTSLDPEGWLRGARPVVVDANAVLSEQQINGFRGLGCRLKIIGRGDI
jgi:UDP-N-acetyl-D-glucosamine dehydrogenase